MFIDRDTTTKTFAEWEEPADVTEEIKVLAARGHLKIVQVINRRLPTLPDELRYCRQLEQLILIYTKTTSIPDWASEFTFLEHL